MEGEVRRLVRRAFDRQRAESLLARSAQKMGPGALSFPFAPDLAALLATYHRTSARLLWDLYEVSETRLEPLFEALVHTVSREARDVFGGQARRISVVAGADLPVEANPRQVVGTVKNALTEGARAQGIELSVDPERPELLFWIRSHESESGRPVTIISLDIAGRPLHERGYRTISGDAPLREDLAALLIMLARFDARKETLIDPMAGAGTIAIEAALMAQGRTIWTSGRRPLLTEHPLFQPEFARFDSPLFADTEASIWACELDESVATLLERSRKTAGVERVVSTMNADFREVDLSEFLADAAAEGKQGGLILTNPPYGGRLDYTERELSDLYRDLYGFWRSLPGFRIALLVGEPDNPRETPRVHLIERAFGGRPRVHKPLKNGPLRASFMLYEDEADTLSPAE